MAAIALPKISKGDLYLIDEAGTPLQAKRMCEYTTVAPNQKTCFIYTVLTESPFTFHITSEKLEEEDISLRNEDVEYAVCKTSKKAREVIKGKTTTKKKKRSKRSVND